MPTDYSVSCSCHEHAWSFFPGDVYKAIWRVIVALTHHEIGSIIIKMLFPVLPESMKSLFLCPRLEYSPRCFVCTFSNRLKTIPSVMFLGKVSFYSPLSSESLSLSSFLSKSFSFPTQLISCVYGWNQTPSRVCGVGGGE